MLNDSRIWGTHLKRREVVMLCLPIVVFTAMLNFPLLPICPQDKTVSDDPIYLVYDMSFAGHYDAVQQQVNQLDQQHQDEQLIKLQQTNLATNLSYCVDVDKVPKENAKKALLVMSTRLDVNASKMCLDVICTVNASTVTILACIRI